MKSFKIFINESNNIGRTWNSDQGTRTIVGLSSIGGKEKYSVQTKGQSFPILIPIDELESWISIDERKYKSHLEMQKRAQETKQKETEERSLDGFEDTLTPTKRGVAIKALTTKGISSDGVFFKNIRDLICSRVKAGARVNEKRRLENPNGTFNDEKQLTKLGIDYAEWLTKNLTKIKNM